MTRHDQLFKNAVEEFLGDLVQLVAPAIARNLRLEEARPLPQEVFTDLPEGRSRQVDVAATVESTEGEPEIVLVHVEIEARARRSMGRRMRRYAMQLELRHDLPVLPIVVYLKGGPAGVVKERVTRRLWDEEMETFSYFAFGLSRSPAEAYLARPEPLAWGLAGLMKSRELTPARRKLECLRPIARAELDEARRFLLANLVETYIELDEAAEEEYRALLAAEENREVEAMEMTWADKIEARGVERGIEEGQKRGREEGLQEGMQEGMQVLILDQLEHRFGPVPKDLARRIRKLRDRERLGRLAEQLLDAESLDELEI